MISIISLHNDMVASINSSGRCMLDLYKRDRSLQERFGSNRFLNYMIMSWVGFRPLQQIFRSGSKNESKILPKADRIIKVKLESDLARPILIF